MKESFEFATDAQSAAFCGEIVNRMTGLFGITVDEAIGRINRDWHGLVFMGADNHIYAENPEHWARTIYYGQGSNWWLNPPGLKPRPFQKPGKGRIGSSEGRSLLRHYLVYVAVMLILGISVNLFRKRPPQTEQVFVVPVQPQFEDVMNGLFLFCLKGVFLVFLIWYVITELRRRRR